MKVANREKIWSLVPALLLAGSLPAGPQQPGQADEPFSQVTQVTAHELVVGFPPASSKRPGLFRRPPPLEAGDLLLTVDGRPVESIDLAPGGDRRWRCVLYVDLVLSTARQVRWQADTLLAALDPLLARGSLEIVVAEELPSVFLASTRDADAAREALSRLALASSSPYRIESLRSEFLHALARPDLGMPRSDLAAEVLAEEGRIARERMDLLLGFLAERAGAAASPRALLLAPGALDLAPAVFYGEALGTEGLELAGAEDLVGVGDDLARNAAALGWVVVGLDGPEPEKILLEGKRIGKWRFKPPAWKNPAFIVAVREPERDPDLAEAHLERGRTLLAAGLAVEARAALERAIHHFHRDPRTADRQAVAWRELGGALEILDRPDASLRAFKTAAKLDPEAAPLHARLVAAEATARSMLDRFAGAGLGWTVTGASDLEDVLASFDRLLVLSYQTESAHDGRLHPLSVRLAGGEPLAASTGWSTWGTSEGVAAARARRLLAESELETGGLRARLELRPGTGATEPTLEIHSSLPVTSRLRVTSAVATPRGVEVTHRTAERGGSSWEVPLALPNGILSPLVAVVEDVATGEWVAAWLEP